MDQLDKNLFDMFVFANKYVSANMEDDNSLPWRLWLFNFYYNAVIFDLGDDKIEDVVNVDGDYIKDSYRVENGESFYFVKTQDGFNLFDIPYDGRRYLFIQGLKNSEELINNLPSKGLNTVQNDDFLVLHDFYAPLIGQQSKRYVDVELFDKGECSHPKRFSEALAAYFCRSSHCGNEDEWKKWYQKTLDAHRLMVFLKVDKIGGMIDTERVIVDDTHIYIHHLLNYGVIMEVCLYGEKRGASAYPMEVICPLDVFHLIDCAPKYLKKG